MWTPIKDLPADWPALSDGELGPLLEFWNDQRGDFEQTGVLARFSERLAREWSIETGQIEGVYDIDRGITRTLIERGIDSELIPHTPGQRPPELIAAIIRDHQDVLEGLFQFVRGDRPLTRGYIHELHAALLRHQETTAAMDQFGHLRETELLKGRYKQLPNSPARPDGTVHEYCPPEHVEAEMDRLIRMHAEHEARGAPVEVEAAWLHHRFAQIHPYQDGNGRVARALASALFIKSGWFPALVTRDDRLRYIDALEVADEGDLSPLVAFFVDVQKRALFQATEAAADVRPVETVDEAIGAIKRVLTGPGRSLEKSAWLRAGETADKLIELASGRLTQIVSSLQQEVSPTRPEFRAFFVDEPLRELADQPRKADYDRNITVRLSGIGSARLGVSAQAVGSTFRGLIAVVALFKPGQGAAQPASEEPFQINYREPYENAERRFRPWLERSLVRALTLWRQSLA